MKRVSMSSVAKMMMVSLLCVTACDLAEEEDPYAPDVPADWEVTSSTISSYGGIDFIESTPCEVFDVIDHGEVVQGTVTHLYSANPPEGDVAHHGNLYTLARVRSPEGQTVWIAYKGGLIGEHLITSSVALRGGESIVAFPQPDSFDETLNAYVIEVDVYQVDGDRLKNARGEVTLPANSDPLATIRGWSAASNACPVAWMPR